MTGNIGLYFCWWTYKTACDLWEGNTWILNLFPVLSSPSLCGSSATPLPCLQQHFTHSLCGVTWTSFWSCDEFLAVLLINLTCLMTPALVLYCRLKKIRTSVVFMLLTKCNFRYTIPKCNFRYWTKGEENEGLHWSCVWRLFFALFFRWAC